MVLALLPSASAAESPVPKDPRDVIGVAHVAGKYHLTDKDFLNEGADKVLAFGSRAIKLYLNQPQTHYPFNTRWPEAKTLVDLARTPPYAAVFAKPFTTFVLTTYSVGKGRGNWRVGLSDDQKANERREFQDLARHLLTTYRGTGKTFVLQHWEGDWDIRGRPDPKIDPTPEAFQGMIDWLNARQDGVARARAEVGEDGVHVYHAAEVNLVVRTMRDGRPGVVDKVLPKTRVDLVSYSAWDAQDDPGELLSALNFIARHAPPSQAFGAKNVYIGEFGKPENEFSKERVRRTIESTVRTGLDWGCPYIIYWQLYCNEPRANPVRKNEDCRGFWLLRPDGSRALAWDILGAFLARAVKSSGGSAV